jgi:hypothetical protein
MDQRTARRILIVDDEPPLFRMMSLSSGPLGIHRDHGGRSPTRPGRWWKPTRQAFAGGAGRQHGGDEHGGTGVAHAGANPSMCILAASGYPVDITALSAEAPGRVAFLLKPFTPQIAGGGGAEAACRARRRPLIWGRK